MWQFSEGGTGRCGKLPKLPREIISEVAEKLSLKDVANLISCCRAMASLAPYLYGQRRRVDMSCFESVTPSICIRLLTIFSRTRLKALLFCYDIRSPHAYDDITLNAISKFFCIPAKTDVHAPRRVEILAHGYFLHRFISSQQHLQHLEVDREQVYVVGSKERRSIVTLDIERRRCPNLEFYWACPHSQDIRTNSGANVKAAFLRGCPRLRFGGFSFVLGPGKLDAYASLTSPLELQCGYFDLRGWDALRGEDVRKVRVLGSRLQKMEAAHLTIGKRGSIQHCLELLKAMSMTPVRFLVFLRHPEMERPASPVFAGAFPLLGQLPRALHAVYLNGVPEEEFQDLIAVNSWDCFPRGVEHLKIDFHWRSLSFAKAEQDLLNKFMQTAPLHLQTCSVRAVPKLYSKHHVFLQTLNRGNGRSCMHLMRLQRLLNGAQK